MRCVLDLPTRASQTAPCRIMADNVRVFGESSGSAFAEIRAVWKLIRILQEELFMFVFGTADDVFGMAIRIEENGFAFYNGAAKKTQETAVKKLFEELANMEQGHVTAFKSLRATMPAALLEPPVWDPEGL